MIFILQYIRKTMRKHSDHRPELTLVHRGDLHVNELLMDPLLNTLSKAEEDPPPVPPKMGMELSWEFQKRISVTFHKAWNVNVVNTGNVS